MEIAGSSRAARVGLDVSRDEEARLRCDLSKSFFEAGDYERAREALEGFWRAPGERPNTRGLGERAAADVLLAAGRLSGALGRERGARDARQAARNLIGEAAAVFERLGERKEAAVAQSELGLCCCLDGDYDGAHARLERARALFVSVGDACGAARCDEARARVLTAEGRYAEAEKAARAAVRGLEEGDRPALLAESLATLGRAQARADLHERARKSLLRAVETAEAAGDRARAGRAALIFAEEMAPHMTARELCEAFGRAHDLLSDAPSPDTLARLNACARRAVSAAASAFEAGAWAAEGSHEDRWEGFSLKAEVLRYESELIGHALRDADGVVSRAAKLLGFKHHQTFVALLNNRHRSLLHARNPIIPRKRGGDGFDDEQPGHEEHDD